MAGKTQCQHHSAGAFGYFGQSDSSHAESQVCSVLLAYPREVFLERSTQLPGENGDSVLASLAVPHHELVSLEIQILHP